LFLGALYAIEHKKVPSNCFEGLVIFGPSFFWNRQFMTQESKVTTSNTAPNSPTGIVEDGRPPCTCSECEEHPPGKCAEKALVKFSPERLLCPDCLMRLKNKRVLG